MTDKARDEADRIMDAEGGVSQGPSVAFKEPTTAEELLALNHHDEVGKVLDWLTVNGELADYDDELANRVEDAKTIIRRMPAALTAFGAAAYARGEADMRERAAECCAAFDGPPSDSDFVMGQATAAQQIRAAIRALKTEGEG